MSMYFHCDLCDASIPSSGSSAPAELMRKVTARQVRGIYDNESEQRDRSVHICHRCWDANPLSSLEDLS